MNKREFLITLEAELKDIDKQERIELLQDYEAHFEFGLEEGKKEEEIAKDLGSPRGIAKEVKASYHIEQAKGDGGIQNILQATLAVIGLGLFNLIIVLGPFLALVSIIFSGWIVSFAGIISPLLVLIDIFITSSFELVNLFAAILFCGLGLLLLVAMMYVTKFMKKIFIRYLSYNVSIVKGGMKGD
ncbi:DUF1700 domain-containing protein [Cytobacillus sp. FSL R5-0569]|uniref:HAAS signaling domain-containing protein n=1 Tax=Cytobacillus sp. FSL R5-0569 TaxID=2921649 RepID=UPI0030FCF2C9